MEASVLQILIYYLQHKSMEELKSNAAGLCILTLVGLKRFVSELNVFLKANTIIHESARTALRGNELVETLVKVGRALAGEQQPAIAGLAQAYVEIIANTACDGMLSRLHE